MPIMRKDVKLGLAVGGVLLAVLVVYALVVPGNSGNQPGADVALNESGGSTGSDSTAAGATDTNTSTAQGTTGTRDTATSGGRDATADAAKHDTATGAGSTGEPASAGGAKTETTIAGNNGHTDGANTGASTDKPTGESAGGGWNWDALVNGSEKVPSLGVATDVPANGGIARSHDATVARNTTADPTPLGGAQATPHAQPQNEQIASAQNNTSSQNAGAVPAVTDGTPRSTDDAQLAGAKTHVVKAGETYSKISQELFGSSKYYAKIEQANPNIDPTRLKPGMTITIPSIDTAKAATPGTSAQATAEKALDPKTQYKVQPGDNLHNISLKLYGKADRVDKIYEKNKATIGEDMARLKVGTVLELPEAPTQSTIAATR
jgi:nucleoid-associated protein YgaU